MLANRLRERLPEIEAAVATRVYSIMDPQESGDPTYVAGLRASLATALDFAVTAVERGEARAPKIPPSLLAQARMAARHEVDLETVLRRYLAGYSLIAEFVMQEAAGAQKLEVNLLWGVVRGQWTLFDRLIQAVCEEYCREESDRPSSTEQRRVERVERLLAGEHLDTAEIAYDFNGHHIGAVASGDDGSRVLRDFAQALGRSSFCVRVAGDQAWMWFGGETPLDDALLREALSRRKERTTCIGLGESAQGLNGWRLTHRQARAALPFAKRAVEPVVPYREVVLLASMQGDDLLRTSLREMFLKPLAGERDGGEVCRQTLRAYFRAERNVTSAAASLGVKRHTVTNRLRAIEELLGRSLNNCCAELEAALRLDGAEFVQGT